MTATKNFRVDSFVSGLGIKAPVKVATSGPITLAGEQTVNSRVLNVGDRVLVKDQADPIQNGIYNVETSAWQRAGDFDGTRDVVTGTIVPAYRVSDGLFVQYILSGTGANVVVPGIDAMNFTVYVDPAVAGAALPASTLEDAILVADNVGGWIEMTGVRADPGTSSLYIDGNLIITDGGANSLQIAESGGDHYTIVTTGGFYLDINPDVRFDSGGFYMLQKAAAAADLAGYGQFWVRTSDDAPMFTTEAGVDYQLNVAPSFSPPLTLNDNDEIQFGTGNDVQLDFDGSALVFNAAAANTPIDIMDAMILRLRTAFGTGYIDIQNTGATSFNSLTLTKVGSTSNVDYQIGAWDHNDNRFLRPVLDDYAIQHATAGSVSNTLDIDFEDGNSHFLELTENVTTMTLSNPPVSGRLGLLDIEILQDSVARTIAWPASVQWPGGTPPNLTTTNATYLVQLRTRDGGTTYLGTFFSDFS